MNRLPRPFPELAAVHLSDEQLRKNLGQATATIRSKRAEVIDELPDWEGLRESARRIKEEVLENLEPYLGQLEEAVTAAEGKVYRARDADEANRIIGDLVAASGEVNVVKVKSITTDEIGMNEALAARGICATETDLAELIIQLAQESSSHFLVPAIHKNRTQIRDLFREHFKHPIFPTTPRSWPRPPASTSGTGSWPQKWR